MVAGLGFHYLKKGETSSLSTEAEAKVQGFSKKGRQSKKS